MNVNLQSNSNGIQRLGALPGSNTQKAASTLGRVMGTEVRESLSPSVLAHDMFISGASNIPFDALFSSQAYRRGDIKANEYAAKVLGNSIGFGMWTLGGALAGVALAPLSLPAVAVGVLGFAAGMTAQELYDRFIGKHVQVALAAAIPEKDAKPIADAFVNYVANPLNDHLWRPVIDTVKEHKVLAAGVAGVVALRFPGAAKVIASEAATMAGGTALGMGVSMAILNPLFGDNEMPFEKSGDTAQVDAKWVTTFNQVRAQAEAKGATRAQSLDAATKAFTNAMIENGAKPEEAKTVVEGIAKASETRPRATGTTRPAGMLMGR